MKKPITPDEFAARMAKIAREGGPEGAHCDADELMCRLLQVLGYGEGIAVFQSMQKWYA
jgi:hypothetical protein